MYISYHMELLGITKKYTAIFRSFKLQSSPSALAVQPAALPRHKTGLQEPKYRHVRYAHESALTRTFLNCIPHKNENMPSKK